MLVCAELEIAWEIMIYAPSMGMFHGISVSKKKPSIWYCSWVCPVLWSILMFNMENLQRPLNLGQHLSGWWCNNHLEKYESQWEGLSHILWKIKNVPNHQPVIIWCMTGYWLLMAWSWRNSAGKSVAFTSKWGAFCWNQLWDSENQQDNHQRLAIQPAKWIWCSWIYQQCVETIMTGYSFFSNQGNHKLCLSKHRERHKTSINGDILGLYSTYVYIYMYIYTVYYVNKPASFNIRTCVHQNGNVHKKSWSLPLDFRAYFRPQGDATL